MPASRCGIVAGRPQPKFLAGPQAQRVVS